MSSALSVEELRELKRGDSVCIQGHMYVIISKGTKWMYTTYMPQPISMEDGLLKCSGCPATPRPPVYRSISVYKYAQERLRKRNAVVASIHQNINWDIPLPLVDDLEAVLIKHGLMK